MEGTKEIQEKKIEEAKAGTASSAQTNKEPTVQELKAEIEKLKGELRKREPSVEPLLGGCFR
ncbi:MAG: hypothetical protein M1286_04465 [Candidatus Marsarchaeota archaeon]|nr:hypothetical protein [Candidatus Marsarchaeota archaeon]